MFSERDVWVSQERVKDLRREAAYQRLVNEALRTREYRLANQAREATRWDAFRERTYRLPLRLLSQLVSGAGQRLVEAGAWLESLSCEPVLEEGRCR